LVRSYTLPTQRVLSEDKAVKQNKLALAVRAAINAKALTGAALLCAMNPASAAVINVGGTCSLALARAIVSANNDVSPQGFCRPGRGAHTIVWPPKSIQTLTAVNNTNYGPTGLPTIRTPITILGNGSTIRRVKSAPKFQIISVLFSTVH